MTGDITWVREAAVAGQFYPGVAGELEDAVSGFLAGAATPGLAPPDAANAPKAIIAPHAGYVYSGALAARAYARLAPVAETITRVVLLGPCHRVAVQGLALSSAEAFRTPLGDIPLDAQAAKPKRISVTGEIVDTWCYVTEIMYALGTAHQQCAVWCAVGGIPVSVKGDDGSVYVVLKVEEDDTSVANPRILKIQTHKVSVEGDLYERDGVKYLIVTKVANDQGIVNSTHEEYGIQPFGK